jgi:hypothetical protein
MTDRTPRPPTPPEDPGREHHGLAEEIREEIADVVEHVPRPVRWTVGKIAWLVGLGCVLVVVVAVVTVLLVLARRTEWVAQEASLFLNQALATRSDVVVEMRDLHGDPLRGLTVVSPRVRFRDGDAPALLEARRVTVSYSFWAMVTGQDRVIEVRMEHPVVRLSRGADGRLRLPRWASGPRAGAGRPMDVRVVLHEGRVEMPKGLDAFEGVDLDVALRTGRPLRVRLARLSWTRGPYATSLDMLRGHADVADSVRVVVDELRGPDLALRGNAAWAARGGERIAHVEVGRVRWSLLARLFVNGAFDVPGEGAVVVDARGDKAWRGDFRSQLTWDSLAVSATGHATWDGKRLRVDPLEADSHAGRLAGWVTYDARSWAVGGDVLQGDPSQWGALRIVGWPAGDLAGRFTYDVDTRTRGRPSSRLKAVLGGSRIAGWRTDSAWVDVDFPFHAPVHFVIDADRRGGAFGLDAVTDPAGWSGTYTVDGLPLEEWPDGRASGLRGMLRAGAGSVRADASGLAVTGVLEGTSSDWLGMHAARWRLDGVNGRILPTPALEATAHLDDVMYLGVHFDSAAVGFGLGDRAAELRRVEARAADTLVTADGRARWDPAGWSLELDHARARSAQFDWQAEPQVRLSGDPRAVRFDRLAARDGDARLDIAGQWAAPGGVYDWDFRGRGLDLGRLGLPLDWGLTGHADVRLEVHGASGDPRWTFTADASRPGAHGHAADSVHVVLAGAPSRAELREGLYTLGAGRIGGTLRVDGTAAPWPDTLTAAGVTRWLATGARWDGAFHADGLPVDRLLTPVPEARGFGGALSGVVDVQGSPAKPEISADATVGTPRWRDFVGEALHGVARYADGRLTVESLRLTHRTLSSEVAGSMPLRLALGRPPEFPEAGMSWRVEMPQGDLALLPLFVPQVASSSGRLEARATLEGTLRHPRLDGFARVHDAAMRLEGREEVLDHLSGDLRFSESRITLDSLRAQQGARGRVSARGTIDLRGLALDRYRFDVGVRDFTATEEGLYAAAFDGDFVVTNGPRWKGQTLPMVEGGVRVGRAAILFDFANQTEMQRLAARTMPLFWVYRVQVEASDNLHWQPPNGDIEFNADLTLEQTVDSLLAFGEMHLVRGTYWFLSNRFALQTADLTFDNVMGLDPTMTVEATTRIVAAPEGGLGGSSSERPVTHTVTALIEGRSSKPTITLSDDQAAWDQPRILRELTLGRVVGAGGQLSGDPVDNYVTRALNRTLSAEMSRLFQGYVSEWTLERERGGLFTGTGDMVATVGVPLGKRLSLRYRSRLGLPVGESRPVTGATDDLFERNLEAEYRLNRFFYVTTEYVQPRGTVTGTSGTPDINLNLKARWEY